MDAGSQEDMMYIQSYIIQKSLFTLHIVLKVEITKLELRIFRKRICIFFICILFNKGKQTHVKVQLNSYIGARKF